MHILLIHQAFAAIDEPGGTRHHELARYLAARGHKVTVITSPISYLTGQSSVQTGSNTQGSKPEIGVTILRPYVYPVLHRSFVHRVVNFVSFMISSFVTGLRVRKVDLVWGTSPPIFQGLTALSLARLKRVPMLFEVRDLWPAFAVQVGVLHNSLLIRASEWLERFLYSQADQVMINSPGFIDHVKERGARKVVVVPNGADTAMFDPEADGQEFRRLHQLEGKFVALYAGAHGMSNDLGVLLQAAEILANHPEITFVLLGDGKEKPALISQAAKMGLTNVKFLPPVPKNEMSGALAAADVCIAILKPIPLYKTVYPNKVFDYMAARRPVVLAIDGVIRQVVESAGAGIFVHPGDPEELAQAIMTLAANPDRARQMGQSGREYLEKHFDRAELAGRLANLMEMLTKV